MYLLRSKSRTMPMRDMAAKWKPVYAVGVKEWVAFVELPAGIGLQGDSDLEVKECDEKEAKKHKGVDIRSEAQVKAQAAADAGAAKADKDHEFAMSKVKNDKADKVAAQADRDRVRGEKSVRAARLKLAQAKKEKDAAKAKVDKARADFDAELKAQEADEDAEIAAMIEAEEKAKKEADKK